MPCSRSTGYQLVSEYRIAEAKRILLADTDRTITSIAYAVGFNSTTVFYDWFNRITGEPPKKYQKKMTAGD
jgi:AraC family transcriptional regulator of adaptative response / methylphosphotriester-DNA alkyltransferase methyltransferase